MKYGIQLADEDGNVKYVYSSKGTPSFTNDRTSMALFEQETTALSTLAKLRRYGFEPKGSTFAVVEVEYTICRVIDVERPKQKAGFALTLKYKGKPMFYTGSKKGEVHYAQGDIYYGWGNENRASVFESELKARERLQELLEYNRTTLVAEQKVLAAYVYRPSPTSYMNIDRTSEHKSRVQKYTEQIDMLENAEIIVVGS